MSLSFQYFASAANVVGFNKSTKNITRVRLYYSAEELLRHPVMHGLSDPAQICFHFRPARPADIVVTRDPAWAVYIPKPSAFPKLTKIIARGFITGSA